MNVFILKSVIMDSDYIVKAKNLKKYFPVKRNFFGKPEAYLLAVDDVSFGLSRAETLGLVGESGCGKSTLGRCLIRLLEPTSGEIEILGKNILAIRGDEMLQARKNMQIVFQDPYSSLNPRQTCGDIIAEGLIVHKIGNKSERKDRVVGLLRQVGLSPEHYHKYPHEFSGGQRQRIGIARAIAVDPLFIVADEPVSSLDVSIQAQIINLFFDLKEKRHISYLFISHDLSVIHHIADRVIVMYLGQIVETATTDAIFSSPAHPYTRALLSAVPVIDPEQKRKRIILPGEIPTAVSPPTGCRFHTRCLYKKEECTKTEQTLKPVSPSHLVACMRSSEI